MKRSNTELVRGKSSTKKRQEEINLWYEFTTIWGRIGHMVATNGREWKLEIFKNWWYEFEAVWYKIGYLIAIGFWDPNTGVYRSRD